MLLSMQMRMLVRRTCRLKQVFSEVSSSSFSSPSSSSSSSSSLAAAAAGAESSRIRGRGLSLLSEALSQIASESNARAELLQQVKAIGRLIRRRDWDPNSDRTCSSLLGFALTPDHVAELIGRLSLPAKHHRHRRRGGISEDEHHSEDMDPSAACVWALRIYIWAAKQAGYRHNAVVRSLVLELWEHRDQVLQFLLLIDNPSSESSSSSSSSAASPEKFKLLIQGYGWAHMPDMAMCALARMTTEAGMEPNLSHFNTLLLVLVHANRLAMTREVYKQMLERGISPDATTYALRVRTYSASGQFDEALKAFRQLLKAGFRPDLKTFGYLLDSMCKAKRARLIYVILIDMHKHRCSPDVAVYHEILEGLCRNDCVKDAEKLVKLIRERGIDPSPFVCNVLAKGQCREGKIRCALIQVHDMIKRGFLPNPDVFDLLLVNLFKEGRIGNICRLLGKLVEKGFVPPISTYDILIYGMCKCEEIDKAFKSWEILMQFRLPGVKAYRALIEGLCNLGRVAEAKLVFRKTMEKGGVGDDAAHDVLILRLKQAGRVIDARECQEILDRRRQREACDGELSSRSILAGDDDSDGGGSHSAEDFSGDEKI